MNRDERKERKKFDNFKGTRVVIQRTGRQKESFHGEDGSSETWKGAVTKK
jgi:hypothetical protein